MGDCAVGDFGVVDCNRRGRRGGRTRSDYRQWGVLVDHFDVEIDITWRGGLGGGHVDAIFFFLLATEVFTSLLLQERREIVRESKVRAEGLDSQVIQYLASDFHVNITTDQDSILPHVQVGHSL